jgi:hypothetical protein
MIYGNINVNDLRYLLQNMIINIDFNNIRLIICDFSNIWYDMIYCNYEVNDLIIYDFRKEGND